ncbi:MAG TPA: branched-chain amino acid ABC transporter substrate-binding protein [Deltaproteobacteria bacterium]|nr:branched-chain amino acid ABC transporter substrate-binding protein [Deltaproteobacteria bacterium]
MKRFMAVALVLLIAATMPFTVCAKETIKLGFITPLTGDVKTYGESSKNAFLLALEQYGKTGRYAINPVIADDRNDPTEGANAALKLITQDKVLALVGPLTSKVSIPVSEICEKYRIPMVTGAATNPKVTVYDGRRKGYIFRACFIDPFQGGIAANFALSNLKAKTAAVLFDVGNDYSKGLAEVFRATFVKGKGNVVAYESYQKDDVDFSALVSKVGLKKPDVLYIPDYYNKVVLIARQVRERGIKSPMLGGDGWDSPELLKAGNTIMGNYFTNHYSVQSKDPTTRQFIARYKAKYGVLPDALAALTYDATRIMLQALDTAKRPSGDEMKVVLSGLRNFKGATGTIRFDKNGDAVKSAVVLKVEKDGFGYVTTVNP